MMTYLQSLSNGRSRCIQILENARRCNEFSKFLLAKSNENIEYITNKHNEYIEEYSRELRLLVNNTQCG